MIIGAQAQKMPNTLTARGAEDHQRMIRRKVSDGKSGSSTGSPALRLHILPEDLPVGTGEVEQIDNCGLKRVPDQVGGDECRIGLA